jgi:iron complex outermembrane receptor protein
MFVKKFVIGLTCLSIFTPVAFSAAENTEKTPIPINQSITIFASRFEQGVDQSLPQTFIITDQEIQKSGSSNVSEVLQKIGGLNVRQNLDGSSNRVIDIRGFGDSADNNVLVLLDGVRLSENEQASARTSLIPLEAIDHIEITRGGNSVLYGDGATGGTINIVTKSNQDNLTVVSAGAGSYGSLQSSVFHAQKNGDLDLTIFGRANNISGYRNNSENAERSLGFSLTNHLSGTDSLGLRLTVNREKNNLPGALPISALNTSPRSAEVPDYKSNIQVISNSLVFFGTFRLEENLVFKFDINHATKSNDWNYNYDASRIYSGYDPAAYPGQSPISSGTSNFNSHTDSISPRIKKENFLVNGGELVAGIDWRGFARTQNSYKTDSDSVLYYGIPDLYDGSNSNQTFSSKAVYARSSLPIFETDSIVIGARRQNYHQDSFSNYYFGGHVNGCNYCSPSTYSFISTGSANAFELQYNKNLSRYSKIYFRNSQNFRFANLDDNNNAFYANSNLKPQTSHDYEAGFVYQDAKLKSSFDVYTSQIRNEIGFDGSSSINYDPTRRQGLETTNRYAVSSQISLIASLNINDSKFTEGQFAGKTVPGASKITGSVGTQYQLNPQQRVSWQTRVSSNAYASSDMSNSQTQRAGYGVHDISYLYSQSHWQIIGSVNNIFNKTYTDTSVYKASYYPLYQLTVYPNFGRSINLMGRYSF